jgi:hypothetical protein
MQNGLFGPSKKNALARSIKEKCLSYLILSLEDQLRYVLSEYLAYCHTGRMHQGMANWLAVDTEGNLMTELKCTGRSAGPLLSETVITDGQWHCIGLVWDGLHRTLFVDGVAVAEDTQHGLVGSEMGLYIGVGKDYANDTFFSGLIDDVRIYNLALTIGEIATLTQ